MTVSAVTGRAPGKIILCGEHAVVHGAPALALAVNRYCETQLALQPNAGIEFELIDLHYRRHVSVAELQHTAQRLQQHHQEFLDKQRNIAQVMTHPAELLLFTVWHCLESLKLKCPAGLTLRTQSTIPIGCGMGSSAALINSVISAFDALFSLSLTPSQQYQLGLACEHLQHGHSSGIDLKVTQQGGFWRYQQDQWQPCTLPPQTLLLVNSGAPTTSTGACVAHTSTQLQSQVQCDDFVAVCDAIQQGLTQQDPQQLQIAIRENHKLLVQLGVVPPSIQQFIKKIEQRGGAAKICGAGSISGNSAGMIWVHAAAEQLQPLLADYGYESFTVSEESHGTQRI